MVWPFTPGYPEHTATEIDGKSFDYIIVGGGTAACVLASRLSEDPNVRVLVLSRGKVKDDWYTRIPIVGQFLDNWGPQTVTVNSEPVEHCNGRQARVFTNQGLGGASRINGSMLTRGAPGCFNDWADLGNTDWSFEKCEPYFKKMENAIPYQNNERRGHNGPLTLRNPPSPFLVEKYLEQAAGDVGLKGLLDANDPESPAMGHFTIDHMVDHLGYRCSAYSAYLPKSLALKRVSGLTICSGVVAIKLQISEDGTTATGVYIVDDLKSGTARECLVTAKREIIVSCGTIWTPQVLMLSGIGPKSHLESHKIPVVRDMPGVGAHLSDHVAFNVSFEVLLADSYIQLMTPLALLWQFILFVLFKTGLMSSTTTRHCMWVRSDAIDDTTMEVRPFGSTSNAKHNNMDASLPENVPDIEYMIIGASADDDFDKRKGYTGLYTALVQPYSRGKVELASADPMAQPKMHYPMLTDPRDYHVARKAARFAMHYIERFRTKAYPFNSVWYLAPGMKQGSLGGSWRDASDEDIDEFARKHARSIYHATSTCRMAPKEDEGVVGQNLKVHGFRNLRVADASVFPKLPSAHTMAPTFMVAERCADFIKRDWAS